MNELVVVLGAAIAVAAAVRSTWSPCGLSMLSTITPLAERSRGHRYGITATWFILGSILGGVTLGALAAGLAGLAHAGGLGPTTASAILAGLAVVTALSDARPFGWHLPYHRRQVNELWLGQYRPWVYAGGFGWQIGFGLATYIMTAALYLMIVAAVVGASPTAALAIATSFGLVRGLAVLLSARITTIEALHRFHRRFDALAEPVRLSIIGVQLVVAAVAAGAVWGLAAGTAVGFAGAAIVAVVTAAQRTRPGSDSPERAPERSLNG